MQNNTINDPKHSSTSKKLRIIGPIVVAIGLIFTIIGLGSFFSAFSSGKSPELFWCCFIGFPLLAVGGWLTSLGYMRKFGSFVASQTAPVAKDTINYIVDGTSDTVANTINKIKGNNNNSSLVCPSCHKENDKNAKFCNYCGKPLTVKCPKCGQDNDPEARYCDNCGERLI